ncbi:late embryogenesis abundant protein [Populus alba x Populus x berolinensis]|uniref:Late embryogenesis abundant protein n=1 Tax=Populus alba x Populus x berolinensis TaxID=444605 RepID=A0AAD6WDE2_9ROSI|nr:late embryogenesis abundant protein [Populus alba x Populus x berolinensis]
MAKREQVRPLAPAAERRCSDEEGASKHHKKRSRKCVKYCVLVTAILVILVTAIIVLRFTVFRVKGPVIKMNGVTITKLELSNGTTPKPGVNITLIADYFNTTTTLYYDRQIVGEARNGPGHARARRTMRMNVTVDIIPDRMMANPNLNADMSSGILSMTTYTRRNIVVKMNCSITLNITSQQIQTQKCKRKVDF